MNSRLQQLFTLIAVTALSGCNPDRTLAPGSPTLAKQGPPTGGAPSDLSTNAQSEKGIALAWLDNSSNEAGFEVHRSATGASGAFTPRTTVAANVTSVRDSGLKAATEYCYLIRNAVTKGNKTTYSSFSNVSCATTMSPPAPPPPSGPPPGAPASIYVYPSSSISVIVTWPGVQDAEGYRIERSTNGGSSWVSAGTHSGAWLGFEDFGRTPEQQVWYRVLAFRNNANSPPSPVGSTTPPATPSNFVMTVLEDQTVGFSWTDNSSAEDGYELWYYINDCSGDAGECYQWWFYQTVPANTTSLRTGTWADFSMVRALKGGGYSSWTYAP